MIVHPASLYHNSRYPLRGLALWVASALLGFVGSEARAGMYLPQELAAPSADGGCLASDAADDRPSDRDGEIPDTPPSVADQQATSPVSGASGTGTSLTSGGPTLAVVLSMGVASGSLEPNGSCLERANAALPLPPTFDFLRPPCRLA